MAFGQKGPGRPRGRPPKDPNARAYSVDEGVYAKKKLDSAGGSVLDPVLARQSMDDVEAALQQVRAQYEQNIDQRIAQASREREAIQEQFNRLKELRVTHSEKTLMEWKRASEARQRHAIESLNAWKQRAEHAEHRIRELEREDGSSKAPEPSRGVHALEEEVARLASKLEVARRERDAQMQRVTELERNQQPTSDPSDDQQAVRGLYEDLTGFYVQDVAVCNDMHNLHRYEMHFTSAGYHDLYFALEESKLELPTHHSMNPSQLRDDLVYIPHLDEVRDANLLASPTMPSHFLEQIRFERIAANKFLGALQRALKR
ncbi:hypothetical protein MYAM1_002868 [Malassezia yamatoensis]|uniref:Monopolin complex subunit Csm1/Pcs1 C-terminal domain-containing protein n=1 Tax=Malassezia yamatoensis TaxID=253288 RepID=A0AAJ6CJU5_9BASI|nr:hypothetical protein MYAM1_002868 [Malassezia yamatoensis]